jgi:quercetin dioxygenase-like cupin family protein
MIERITTGKMMTARMGIVRMVIGRLAVAALTTSLFTVALTHAALAQATHNHAAPANGAKISLLYDHPLPNVPGKSLRGVLVEYAPGGTSPPHLHAKSAFITATVLDGAIRSQVNDAPAKVYKAGESFTEMPGDRHNVSENASATDPARLLAVFVVDSSETTLTFPAPK